MAVTQGWLLMSLISCSVRGLSPVIRRYEGLSYDRSEVHQRATRDTQPHGHTLQLDFTAFHRAFRLRLRRDTTVFSPQFQLVSGNRASEPADLSHLYSGELQDEAGSWCRGSVLQGRFEGSIHTAHASYHVEPAERFAGQPSSQPSQHSQPSSQPSQPSSQSSSQSSQHSQSQNHSIIYRQDDLDLSHIGDHDGFCGSDRLQHLAQSLLLNQGEPVSRSRRTVDLSKTSCLLHLHADHLYFKKFRSVEAVVAQVASYIQAVNDIYDKADFDGIKLINFKVKSLTVVTEEDQRDPLQKPFLGPEKLLSLYSEHNWGNYCLSYLLTNRDFSGVLGLAWEGKPGNWGGVCSRHTPLRNGANASLNTGLITLQNYGQHLPARHVQLTLAHELGHSLGAPHDEGLNCGNLGSTEGKGRFLMFPHATNEVLENNDKFSPCSIKQISKILQLKMESCFVVSDQPICGNQIVELGEECDVGHSRTDPCCYSAEEAVGKQCHLKPEQLCSPSQGLCCTPACGFKPRGRSCEEEADCQEESFCSGASAACPEPPAKPNMTVCSRGTRVCLHGDCALSVCVKHGLEQCDCLGNKTEKCHMCCQQPDHPSTCASTTSSVLTRQFQGRRVALVAGAPCSANQGYCDKFHACRLLDADGPIARLKNAFLHLDDFPDLAEWMKAHWWAILLAILSVSAVMGCTVCLCGRTLDTDDLDQ